MLEHHVIFNTIKNRGGLFLFFKIKVKEGMVLQFFLLN